MTTLREREHRRNIIVGLVLTVATIVVILLVVWFVINVGNFIGNVFGVNDGSVQTDDGSGGNVDDPSVQGAGDRTESPSPSPTDTSVACDGHHYYGGDDDADGAAGPAFSSSGKNGVTAEALDRITRDTALASLTDANFALRFNGIDARTRSFNRDCDAWQSSVDDSYRLMRGATYSTTKAPEGSWVLTLVHRKSGVPYVVRQHKTADDETAAVYTVNGTDYMFLPDEGFAPVSLDGRFPYVPTDAEAKAKAKAAADRDRQSSGTSSTGSGSQASAKPKAHAGDSDGKGANVGVGDKEKVTAPSGGSETPGTVQGGSKGSGSGGSDDDDGSSDGINAGKPPKP